MATMHRYHDGKTSCHKIAFGSVTRPAAVLWALLTLACSLGSYAQEPHAAQRLAFLLPPSSETVWVEAETMGPLHGSNFSFQQEAQQTRGSWSLSGPGVAAEWTQGGESEFMSIAARADEAAGVSVGRNVEIPAAGSYTLWVRYADYRNRMEEFGVRVRQGGQTREHVFGRTAVIDELDSMKLFWDWAFGWDSAPMTLEKGPARIELYTTGPTGARRHVDCLCFTTDAAYRPTGRQKPAFAAWSPLRAMQSTCRRAPVGPVV